MEDLVFSNPRALKGGGGGSTELDFPHLSLAFVLCSWFSATLYQLTLRWCRRGRLRGEGDGLFVLGEWGEVIRMVMSFSWMFFICIPAALLTNGWIWGGLMAIVEGWSLDDGYYYVIANFLGLFNALTDKSPDTPTGDYLALFISIYALIVTFMLVGFLTMVQLVVWQSDAVPDTLFGLIRYILFYIPLGLLLAGSAMGGLVSGAEKWSYKDGFFHMTGTLCAIANPIDDEEVSTQSGMFFESYCACLNLALFAMVITIVTQHPHIFSLVSLFEGKFSSYHDPPQTSEDAILVNLWSSQVKSSQDYVSNYTTRAMLFENEDLQNAKDEADGAIHEILKHPACEATQKAEAEATKAHKYMRVLESECRKLQDMNSKLKAGLQKTPLKSSSDPSSFELPGASESSQDARRTDDGLSIPIGS